MKKKIALLMACVMTLCVAIGGTLAWLTATDEPVTNVFTPSDISIDLAETTGDEYKMIPGWTIEKDPIVTVKAGSEDCWVFIKVEEIGGVVEYTKPGETTPTTTEWDDFLTYTIDTANWTQLKDDAGNVVAGVYVQTMPSKDITADRTIKVLGYTDSKGGFHPNEVKVQDTVTKEMMNALLLDEDKNGKFDTDTNGNFLFDEENVPQLKFTAYATQLWKNNDTEFGAYEAWQQTAGYVAP